MDPSEVLRRISVVLVRPRQPENIGFVARAVANHGLGPLILVEPTVFDPERARWSAPGAKDRINNVRIFGRIEDAVRDFEQVFACTARERRYLRESWNPHTLCSDFIQAPRSTAILFGPEDSGLTNEDIACCRALIRIPTADTHSLNLAQAVTTICSLFRHELGTVENIVEPNEPQITMAAQEILINEVMEILELTGYLHGRNNDRIRTTLFQLLLRIQEDGSEVGILRSMLKGVRHHTGLIKSQD